MTDGLTHDVRVLDDLPIEPAAFYILDRGYLDFSRLYTLHQNRAFFVIRSKLSAVMGRGQERIFKAIKEIRSMTPFEWRGIDSENDNAFINDQLYRYTESKHLAFTRSRPYRKNDNAYIEQKNFTHVRRPLRHLRYDTPEELALINDLYRNELRLYKNFCQPVMRLVHKERIDGRVRRRYDKPQTPYRILRESGQLPADKIEELDNLYRSLNPADLKRRIDRKLKKLFALYEKKKKGSVRVNPYKKLDPSSLTFLVMQ